jgi:RNA polymerase sigma-70 factor (ECF subfamily)
MSNDTAIDPDNVLLPRLLAGDKAAFEALVRQHHMPLMRVAAAIIGEGQAEEVVQEAWAAVIRGLPDFQARSSLKTWLYSIVANEAKGRLRKSRREVVMENPELLQPCDDSFFAPDGHWRRPPAAWHDDSPEALLSHEDFRRCLDKTLHLLPADQKTVLTLREYQGLTMEEICNILKLSASNVRVLIHRARLKVHAMVERYEETGKC